MAMSLSFAAPATIGPFRIVRPVGQGAMGTVYFAERMEQFAQRVAIKMLHPQVGLVLGSRSLQHEEAVLTSLDHPSIVRLLDTGESEGHRYIVMEYVEGLPLDAYCREHSLAKEARVLLLLQAARALDYAHRRLVVHADLKPENILVMEGGHLKLLDFGVAVLVGPSTSAQADVENFFTPAFAAPEQLAGERATVATDVYSLGRVSRLLLGGVPGRELTAVLDKATRDEPQQRYGSARAFADDLQAVLEHRPVAARKGHYVYRLGRWARRHWAMTTIAGGVALVMAASVAGVAVSTMRATRERTRAQAQLADVVKLTGALAGELYDSAKPLAHAGQPRATLLKGATQTLDNLSVTVADEPQLALEMARQYEVLAQLERDENPGGPGIVAGQHDLDKARVLLERTRGRNAGVSAELQRVAQLRHAFYR